MHFWSSIFPHKRPTPKLAHFRDSPDAARAFLAAAARGYAHAAAHPADAADALLAYCDSQVRPPLSHW